MMLYNYETLKTHCLTNDIQLVNDYADVKMNREVYIIGICKTITDNCEKIFDKTFRQLVKTGPYCLNCAIENGKQKYKLQCKYNLQYLSTFCNQNNIILIDEYSKTINRTEVPELWYTDKTNKLRRHFVDIYIKSQNRCIEVKSAWTNQEKNNVLEKKESAIKLGYKYDIWIFDRNGNKLQVL